jgi:hypothetical protein
MSPAKKVEPDPVLAQLDGVARRLDALIALQIRSVTPPSMSDQIRTLADMGFDNPAIARIVGRDSAYISATRGRKSTAGNKKKGSARKARKAKKR